MPRALGRAALVLGLLLTHAAQKAAAEPQRLAVLGEPQAQAASVSASKPTAWESLPPAPAVPPTPSTYTGTHTTLPRPVYQPIKAETAEPAPISPPSAEPVPTPQPSPLLENLSFFIGLDGSREPIDLGVNANFGYRLAVNWGLPLMEEAGLGLQVGTAFNHAQNALPIMRAIDSSQDRWQNFTTVGLFQRTAWGLRWGMAYDFRFDDYYYGTFSSGQWRAQAGMEVGPDDEFGCWATMRDHGYDNALGRFAYAAHPINQWNCYWRHVWEGEIVTRLWVGIAEEHGRFNLLVPGQPHIRHPVCFGGDLFVPLSDTLAIFGQAHFITPNDTGTVTATLGVSWTPGSARGTARSRFAPLQPVGNNATFALDVR